MTLVEVVGGLALLATLLVAILLAKARYTHQAAAADRRLQAVAAADALLTAWHRDARLVPRAGNGQLGGDLAWRTHLVTEPAAKEMGAAVVRLEILDDRPTAAANPLVTSVEFVVDVEVEATQPTTAEATPTTPTRGGAAAKKPVAPKAGSKRAEGLHHP